mgnify:CR=1 FL=1
MAEEKPKTVGKAEGWLAIVFFVLALVAGLLSQ